MRGGKYCLDFASGRDTFDEEKPWILFIERERMILVGDHYVSLCAAAAATVNDFTGTDGQTAGNETAKEVSNGTFDCASLQPGVLKFRSSFCELRRHLEFGGRY